MVNIGGNRAGDSHHASKSKNNAGIREIRDEINAGKMSRQKYSNSETGIKRRT
ncbi:hypothetical protein HZA99_01255 [Candidatus Woesearchaeota archaeon]|nr:hypothetical protein [Candidatus Woesearchaeota archaeon]